MAASPPPELPAEAWFGVGHPAVTVSDEHTNGALAALDHQRPPASDAESPDYTRGSSVTLDKKGDLSPTQDKIKPNKVYVGGLPEHTRKEDLQNCFGKLGDIVNIELKTGYGFVEFDSKAAAEDSVAKYHDGYFMGNKIRVELSHGGGRLNKYNEPGACFKCGSHGHWARECPNHGGPQQNHRRRDDFDRPDREYHPRDHPRDYRRASPPPPRDYRDFPPPPLPRGRDYDDYRRGLPPPPPPPLDRYGPPPPDFRGRYPPPPPLDPYRYGPPPPLPGPDRYDRRPPPLDRLPPPGYLPPPPPPGGRLRSPPRFRDDYDRPPPPLRDYPDYRRTMSPPGRYDYPPPRLGGPDGPIPRYR